MKPLKIAEGIYDVGVKDWNVRDFHGYSTDKGTTYNSFLIMDEKIVLVDTVKDGFGAEHLRNISKIVDPKKIDIVISNHTEMDHTGTLVDTMRTIGVEKPLYCSKMGEKNLKSHFSDKLNYQVVDNAFTLPIGKRTLQFLETRMLHWPDSMFTYIPEDKILFSSDAFGQHYAGQEDFDDQIGPCIMEHAKKYYANILLLFSSKVKSLIETVSKMNLDIQTICPDHGIIWRKDPSAIINKYMEWSEQKPEKKAVVIFDTMWHSTEKMAESIAAGLNASGVYTMLMHARKWHRSDIMTEVLDAGLVVIGSPTMNNVLYPTLSDVMTYMKGLRPQNKKGASFGSYGWSGEAVKLINAEFESMGFTLAHEGLKVQYVPDEDQLSSCFQYGQTLAESLA